MSRINEINTLNNKKVTSVLNGSLFPGSVWSPARNPSFFLAMENSYHFREHYHHTR